MIKQYLKPLIVPIIIGFILLIVGNVWFYLNTYDLIKNQSELLISTYSDSQRGGSSTISFTPTPNTFQYVYIRKDGYIDHPYAGISILKKDNSFFSVNGRFLHIVAQTQGSQTINLRLEIFANGFTDTSDKYTYVYVQKIISGDAGIIDKTIDLNDLEVPTWWTVKRGITSEQVPDFNFKKTAHIILDHDPTVPLNKKVTVTLTSFAFIPNPIIVVTYNVVVIVLCFIVFFFIVFAVYKKKEYTQIVAAPLLRTDLNTIIANSKEAQIIDYLSKNYTNSELSLTMISEELGISTREISDIIKQKFKFSFKQYLNFLRMEEAKYLLLHSNLQLKEIAFKVGYETQQHFLRVFKLIHDITPTEFKKNVQAN